MNDMGATSESAGSLAKGRSPTFGGKKHTGSVKGRKPLPAVLKDMRAVYAQAESQDRTPGQKLCRTLLKDNPKGFLTMLGRLEQAHRAGVEKEKKAAVPAVPEKPDETDGGEERARELIGRLLGE